MVSSPARTDLAGARSGRLAMAYSKVKATSAEEATSTAVVPSEIDTATTTEEGAIEVETTGASTILPSEGVITTEGEAIEAATTTGWNVDVETTMGESTATSAEEATTTDVETSEIDTDRK